MLLIGVVIFSLAAPGKFLSPLNLSVVLQQVTIVAILGMAQTLVILTAGIDLSVGLIMILCHVVMGRTAVVFAPHDHRLDPGNDRHRHRPVRHRAAELSRSGCSPASPAERWNGVLVTALRLPPFIVTLGTWSIFGALNTFYSTPRPSARRTWRRRPRTSYGWASCSSSTISACSSAWT